MLTIIEEQGRRTPNHLPTILLKSDQGKYYIAVQHQNCYYWIYEGCGKTKTFAGGAILVRHHVPLTDLLTCL